MAYEKCFVTMSVEDSFSRVKTKRVELVTTDSTQAEIDAAFVVQTYQAAIDGLITKWAVTGENYVAGPAGPSNVDTGVTMSCQLAGRAEKAANKWPTPDTAYINIDGTVDLANALVVAVQNLYVAPGGVARLSDGETITGFVSGKLDK